MGKSKRARSEERADKASVKEKPKLYSTAAMIAVVLVAALIGLTVFAVKTHHDKRALREQLDEAARQAELQDDVIAAMEARQEEQDSVIQDLLRVEEQAPVITSDQIQDQINSVRELAVKDYVYRNAARREASKTWLWGWTMPFSGTSLLVTYDGTIKYGIDLSEVDISVDGEKRAVTITLPPSKVISHEIPQGGIEILEVKDSLFNEVTFDDYNTFIEEEKRVMEENAAGRGLLTEADKEARTIIRAFLELIPGMDTYTLEIK